MQLIYRSERNFCSLVTYYQGLVRTHQEMG